jgi:hypothetical protein
MGGIAAVLFLVAGVGDMIWHTVFGIETGLDAALSPTHLLLVASGTLLLTSPLRSWWASQRAMRVRRRLNMDTRNCAQKPTRGVRGGILTPGVRIRAHSGCACADTTVLPQQVYVAAGPPLRATARRPTNTVGRSDIATRSTPGLHNGVRKR